MQTRPQGQPEGDGAACKQNYCENILPLCLLAQGFFTVQFCIAVRIPKFPQEEL